jgi:hypothetical protein
VVPVNPMQMPIVNVIYVIPMLDCLVATVGSVYVIMVIVNIARAGCLVGFGLCLGVGFHLLPFRFEIRIVRFH